MDKLIQTIQDEINNIMKSKIAQKSDKQLWAYDKMKTPYELVVKMYAVYQNEYLSMKDVGKRYGLTANGVNKAFDSWGFKTRTCREGQLKHHDDKESDIKNGISEKEFCQKYNTHENTYYRYRKNLGMTGRKERSCENQMDLDIKNGMTLSEYKNKYNVQNNAYFSRKRKLKKDLVD
jgi:hypothetical protein